MQVPDKRLEGEERPLTRGSASEVDVKRPYHHGELRQALIDAARQLIGDRDGNDFSLSDACRLAGVSTAAPYRHFADKKAIVTEVVAQGFADMKARAQTEAEAFPPGSPERIQAVGRVYVSFAIAEPALFRMMFSHPCDPADADDVAATAGKACFDYVLGEVVSYCTIHGISGDARMIAVQLWTMVHGAASLTIDGDYAKVSPDIDVTSIITLGAERLLFQLPRAVSG